MQSLLDLLLEPSFYSTPAEISSPDFFWQPFSGRLTYAGMYKFIEGKLYRVAISNDSILAGTILIEETKEE